MAHDIVMRSQILTMDFTLGDLVLELELRILAQASCDMFIFKNKWNWNTVSLEQN